MTLALRYAALSHVGLLRTGNEDSVYAGPRLLAVADGMGGHAAGEVASAVAIASLAALDEDAPGADLLATLRQAAVGANAHLRDMVDSDATLDGMGTTLTTLLFTGNRLGLLHIGDSRCYLLRDGILAQITHDDTFVQSLVDQGRITAEQAGSHPQRNMILRALDGRDDVQFDLSMREALAGDRYLLCSDGLTGPVGRENLQAALGHEDPRAAAERLVELALRGGGPDNITVIVADVVDGESTGVPVVAGAAAESPQAAPPHLASGAAGRAAAGRAAAAPRAPVPAPRPAARAGPHLRRATVLTVAVLALLAGGVGTGWAYVRSQWYVGSDGQQVNVYRGLTGSIAGVHLFSVQEHTGVQTRALSELDRSKVERGIRADGQADARRIVTVLHDQARCAPPTTPTPTPTPELSPPPAGSGPMPTAPPAGSAECPAPPLAGSRSTPGLTRGDPSSSPGPTPTGAMATGTTPTSPTPTSPTPTGPIPTGPTQTSGLAP